MSDQSKIEYLEAILAKFKETKYASCLCTAESLTYDKIGNEYLHVWFKSLIIIEHTNRKYGYVSIGTPKQKLSKFITNFWLWKPFNVSGRTRWINKQIKLLQNGQ